MESQSSPQGQTAAVRGDAIDSAILQGVRVLLVEDYLINVKMAQRFMHKWGIVVDAAENGQIAINKFQTGQYDLVLMDLEMPIMDGYTATEAIRGLNAVVPILALTASAPFSNEDRAYAVGMTDYVSKPFNPGELFEKIALYSNRLPNA